MICDLKIHEHPRHNPNRDNREGRRKYLEEVISVPSTTRSAGVSSCEKHKITGMIVLDNCCNDEAANALQEHYKPHNICISLEEAIFCDLVRSERVAV